MDHESIDSESPQRVMSRWQAKIALGLAVFCLVIYLLGEPFARGSVFFANGMIGFSNALTSSRPLIYSTISWGFAIFAPLWLALRIVNSVKRSAEIKRLKGEISVLKKSSGK